MRDAYNNLLRTPHGRDELAETHSKIILKVAQVGFEDRLSWGQCAKPKGLAEQEIAWLI
jgi:hypothetical protein